MCQSGILKLDVETIRDIETQESIQTHIHEEWFPDMQKGTFSAWLRCNNPECGEMASIMGESGLEPIFSVEGGTQWETVYTPKLLWPMPEVISIPKGCPKDVADALRRSFKLLWLDRDASANRIRVSIEKLLDNLGVINEKGMTLHRRIEIFQSGQPTLGGYLMAVKWLGNTASHEGDITHDALLDAYEIIEHALSEIIGERTERISALADKLTNAHRR